MLLVHSRRDRAVLRERPRGGKQAAADPDHHRVAAAEMLLRPVVDRTHALRYGLVLKVDSGDAGVLLVTFLRVAVELIIIALVRLKPEPAQPAGRVRQHLRAWHPCRALVAWVSGLILGIMWNMIMDRLDRGMQVPVPRRPI
jgi:hypothetical protein